jgi:hypothetical protein
MKKVVISIIILILIIFGGYFIYFNYNTNKVDMSGKEVSLLLDQVNDQKDINAKLDKISLSKTYTFSNPYVELNPYGISPLSAIIIFNTSESTEVEVYINDDSYTKMESSISHVIPIYGLLEDYDNVIRMVINGEESIVNIKTDKSNINYPLNVEYASSTLNNETLYFTTASYETYFTGWDIEGNLRFYLTVDNRMDVEWLDNGHFLIGVSQGQSREQFIGFVEMDYLGKIYNYYTLENGYSFEFQILSDGTYMLAGGDKAVYMDHQMVYQIDPSNGNKLSELDIYEVIKAIDPDFKDKFLGASVIRNGFYYNEETNELLVSFRDINTIFSFNYKNKTLNWVFVDPDNEEFSSSVWDDYKIEVESGRYPLAQHTPQITKDGYIAFFNNGYDRYKVYTLNQSDAVSDFSDAYSSCEVYKIEDKKAKLVWSYDNNKSLFSIKYGLFRYNDDDTKLMNFGYILTDEYRSNSSNSIKASENLIDSMYAMIIELDSEDNVIFKATSDEGKFRVFKHNLYNETTENVSLTTLNIYNTIEDDKLSTTNIKDVNLDNAEEWIYTFELTDNTLTTNYSITETDKLDIYFVNSKGKIYILNYKNSNNTNANRIFNLSIPNDKYKVYVSLNDILYKIDNVYVESTNS